MVHFAPTMWISFAGTIRVRSRVLKSKHDKTYSTGESEDSLPEQISAHLQAWQPLREVPAHGMPPAVGF